MKKIMLLTALVVSAGVCTNVYAQQSPAASAPTVSGDKNLRDMDVKTRSIELERIRRDADKSGAPTSSAGKNTVMTAEDRLAAKYAEIKTDYEQIQLLQDAIIKAYQGSGKIDYAQISKSAADMNKGAARLSLNLFPVTEALDSAKTDDRESKKENKAKPTKSVRDLIVDLDNAISRFVASSMFQNLRVVDAAVSEKAKLDLEKIIELSALLETEAQKTAASGK